VLIPCQIQVIPGDPPALAGGSVGVKGMDVPDSPDHKKFPWQPFIIFFLLAVGLLSLSYIYTARFRTFARTSRESQLATVADLKSVQVAAWREDRFSTVKNIFESRYFVPLVQALIKDQGSDKIRQELRDGLSHLQRNFPGEYTRVAIVLPGGRVLFSSPETPAYVQTRESTRLGLEAWASGKIIFGDIKRDPDSGRISIPIVFPLLAPKGNGSEPLAIMAFDIDPSRTLYPLVTEWPSPNRTEEVLLIEREGKNFLYLSEPRYQSNVALNLRLPITRFRRPGQETPIGEEGLIEGADYRGHQVVGYVKAVPDSLWLIEAKMDLGEITAGWTQWTGLLSGIILLFILAAGTSLSLFWKRQKASLAADERAKWDLAVKNQDDFLRVMIDVMPNAAYLKDSQSRFIACNAAFEKLLGVPMDKIVGRTFSEFASGEAAEKDRDTDRHLLEKPGVQVYESPLKAGDGADHHIIYIKSTFARPDGRTGGLTCTLIDITQRKRSEEELQQIRRFSDGIIQTMTEGVVLTDSEGRFSFVNPAAAAILGYTPGEMVDREVTSFVPQDQRIIVRRADERRAKGIADRYELDFLHKDGSRRTFLVSGGPRFAGVQYGGTMAVLTDITDRKRMEEEIRALSLADPLTGLYNRRGFKHLGEQQLKIATRLGKRVILLYSDVDDLKGINDTYGHDEGDRALCDVATILKTSFRDSDIVARVGGDEFVVLAMEAARVNADVFARRLRDKLELHNSRPELQGRYRLDLSTGISTYDPELPSTIDELISRADSLMYELKRRKKR
jgi:diguanylate cyclase (GGDEF)-like protein/PAS domain S-box-containing protein